MKINFNQILQPMKEAITINGEPFLIDKRYEQPIIREDSNIVFTFDNSGTVHLELKECRGINGRAAYVICNNFLNAYFPNCLRLVKQKEAGCNIIFGFIEFDYDYEKDGKKYKRSVNIENALTIYDDGTCEHDGINFYVDEKVVGTINNKKNKKKKK